MSSDGFICNFRYKSKTGAFTVPSGGDGFYYFSTYLLVDSDEWGRFGIQINGDVLCTVQMDQQSTATDEGQAACSAATYATEGRLINNYLRECSI